MGKVLVLCAGEQDRWQSAVPKQIIPVIDGEHLLARTVRQVRKRMNNFPHVVSHQKCLRTYSSNYVVPSAHRWICETLLSVSPIWGGDWTMVLLGDVMYTDELMDSIYKQREKFHYHFYGVNNEIYAISFTSNGLIEQALIDVVSDAVQGGKGKLWDLYCRLSSKPIPDAGHGYLGDEDDLHYTYVLDESRDFDTVEGYREWKRQHRIKEV